MNRPLTLSLSPSEGERVPERAGEGGMVHGSDVRNFPGNFSRSRELRKLTALTSRTFFATFPCLKKKS